MMAQSRWSPLLRLTLSLPLCALLAAPVSGQVVKRGTDFLSSLAFAHEKLQAAEQIEPLGDVRAVTAKSLQDGWEAFRLGAGSGSGPDAAEWQASIDKRTGLVAFAEGGGLAWVPGHGNSLTVKDLGGTLKDKPRADPERLDLEILDAVARGFLPRVQTLLGVDPAELVLARGRSGQPAAHVWFVDYDVVREGMPIEGARVVFRVNNGNLIQYGTENLPAPSARVPATKVTREQARAVVARYIGGFQAGDTMRDDGPHLVPSALLSARSADGYDFGNGRGLTKVWRITFKRLGMMGTWQRRSTPPPASCCRSTTSTNTPRRWSAAASSSARRRRAPRWCGRSPLWPLGRHPHRRQRHLHLPRRHGQRHVRRQIRQDHR